MTSTALTAVHSSRVSKQKGNPIVQAAAYGTASDVARLLRDGADANSVDDSGWTPLMLAATRGNRKMLKFLLKSGAHLDSMLSNDQVNDTSLHMAAKNGHVEAIDELLLAGADVNFTVPGKPTPLTCAAGNGQLTAVERLLKAGADPNILCSDGWSALLLAALGRGAGGRHVEVMKALVAAGADLEAADTRDGRTALIVSTMEGHFAAAEFLISAGADLYPRLQQNGDFTTPVMLAAIKGHVRILQKLIAAGADVQMANNTNSSAVTYAAVNGQSGALDLLLEAGADPDPYNSDGGATPLILITYSPLGKLECVRSLIKYGADINAVDSKGKSAIVHAAVMGKFEIVEYLIHCGSDPNTMVVLADCIPTVDFLGGSKKRSIASVVCAIHTDAQSAVGVNTLKALIHGGADVNMVEDGGGATALHTCASKDNEECAKILLKNGARLDVGGYEHGEVPLLLAASKGRVKIIKLFLQYGADPDASDTDGWTALMHAALQGHVEAVQILVDSGANPNAKTLSGRTALATACRKGHLQVVKALIKAGADVNLPRGDGSTPLMVAAERGHVGVVSALCASGAAIDAVCEDRKNHTALSLAATKGHKHVVQVLQRAQGRSLLNSFKTPPTVAAATGGDPLDNLRELLSSFCCCCGKTVGGSCSLACTACDQVCYCSEMCRQKDARRHRPGCGSLIMPSIRCT